MTSLFCMRLHTFMLSITAFALGAVMYLGAPQQWQPISPNRVPSKSTRSRDPKCMPIRQTLRRLRFSASPPAYTTNTVRQIESQLMQIIPKLGT
jgi:hypothetical protein